MPVRGFELLIVDDVQNLLGEFRLGAGVEVEFFIAGRRSHEAKHDG